jgi:hypothetical protein
MGKPGPFGGSTGTFAYQDIYIGVAKINLTIATVTHPAHSERRYVSLEQWKVMNLVGQILRATFMQKILVQLL